MGSAASIWRQNGFRMDESCNCKTSKAPVVPNYSPPAEISTYLMVYNVDVKLDRGLVKLCEVAWQKIASTNQFAPGTRKISIFAFCENFFKSMRDLDKDEVVVPKFKPRSISTVPNRNALLLKIVRYMLSIPNDKFSSKSKIRKLGRAHASRNIRELHFKVFAEAFMRSLVIVGGKLLKDEAKRLWCQLLNFFVNELTFENVSFLSHHSTRSMSDANMSENLIDLDSGPGLIDTDSGFGSGPGLDVGSEIGPIGQQAQSVRDDGFISDDPPEYYVSSNQSGDVDLEAEAEMNVLHS